jgi:hypothetical protein
VSPVYHDNSHWIQLRTLVCGYLDITGEIIRLKNRQKASELLNESSKFVANNLFNQIEYLESEKETV